MRVVLLINADSIFCKEYVEYVLFGKYETLIVSRVNTQYRQYYRENGIKVLCYSNIEKLVEKLEKKICSDDIFHVHYVNIQDLRKLWRFWLKCRKRILSYWGSDLLRVPTRQILATLPFLYSADSITVINKEMRQKLKKYMCRVKWRHIKCLDFGNSTLDKIDEVSVQMSSEKCKEYLGLDSKKVIISVGYNAIREQQHLEMMREVVKLPKELIDKAFFLFHFGYGAKDDVYISQLTSFLHEKNVPYKIITEFMDKEDIAVLRLCTDIFLYGQTTDALSCSVIEHLYAGAILVKPVWLDYLELKKKGIKYYEYVRFNELSSLLAQLIYKKPSKINRGLKEHKILRNLSSWDRLSSKWLSLYMEEANGK